MRKYLLLIIVLFLCRDVSARQLSPPGFRIIAYVPEAGIEQLDSIPYHLITQINYAFINPGTDGIFRTTPFLDSLVIRAHQHQVKVLLSVGGGNPPAYFTALLVPRGRQLLIHSLVELLQYTGADGIDIDLEGAFITEHYEGFVSELKAALPEGKRNFTAALATYAGDAVTDKALSVFDYVNIMSYDKTGPWNPANPGPHATYAMAIDDLYYWHNIRKVKRERLVLGLPFYGYSFGPAGAGSLSFATITGLGSGAERADEWKLENGNIVYYNGVKTIRKKTELSLKDCSGVMFWQVFQDHKGEHSLLSVIHKVVYP
ncbi:MAG: glycosyl hydrolase family 18 protein [Agriterribacter sp.]